MAKVASPIGKELLMAARERARTDEGGEILAALLKKYPPIRRLEEFLGPAPTSAEEGEVEAFLRARAGWQ